MAEDTRKTLEYYRLNSQTFTNTTLDVGFTDIQDSFLKYLEPGSLILDFGCGSGRDSRYFLSKGYQVEATDGSEEMVKIAAETTGIPVKQMLFNELNECEKYDGVFACASILHVPSAELPEILERIKQALKPEGVFYVSFKYGTFEGYRNGRYFTDMNEERFSVLMQFVGGYTVLEQRITSDVRPGRGEEKWLNVFLRKSR